MQKEPETIVLFEERKRAWDVALILAAGISYANLASAQDFDFLNAGEGLLKAFIGHPIWGTALAVIFAWQLVMYGLTRKMEHLIYMIIPALVAAGWINRSNLVAKFAPGITL